MTKVATLEDVKAELVRKTARSSAMFASSHEVLCLVATGTLAVPHPIYIEEARGARVIDVDGNEYIDLTMGFGPHILGHAPEVVVDAVKRAAERGLQWALHNPYQEPLARLIVDASPCAEKVMFCNSGTEATMHAIRAARAFTGRSKIAVFDGCYHGAHDYVLVTVDPTSPRDAPSLVPSCDGIPRETQSTVVMLPYWSDAAFDIIRAQKEELALVLIEPVQGGNPQVGHVEWLRGLRRVCEECDVPLLFDEIITGFRLAYGGAQERFGIVPDLATYGKALGGGTAIGAVAGRSDIMSVISYQRPAAERDGASPAAIYSAGTFSGNPLSMAAGYATVAHLRDHPEIYRHLATESARLTDEINDFCDSEGLPARILGAQSLMFLRLHKGGAIRTSRDLNSPDKETDPTMREADDALFLFLLNRGVIIPGVHQFHISAAHSVEDVDFVIDALEQSFLDVRAAGLL